MSKRVLPLVVALLLPILGLSLTANAGVEGSFDFMILIDPQTTGAEASPVDLDIEGQLDLSITLSGLTFTSDLTMGIPGIEYYIGTLQTTLGALDITSEFAFATPFYGVMTSYWGWGYFFDWMHPKRGHYGGVRRGELMFIKKRVTMEMTLGGLTLWNLFMFEDVNFPSPMRPDPGVDYTTADQVFAVGDIIKLEGTTVSGIEISSLTTFCADLELTMYYPKHQLLKFIEWGYNLIKKKRWLEAVVWEIDKGIYCDFPDFTKEAVFVSNIPVAGGITMDMATIFSPILWVLDWYPWFCPADGAWCWIKWRDNPGPTFTDIVVQVPVMANVDFLAEFYIANPLALSFDASVLTLTLGEAAFIHWYDNNGDLSMNEMDDVVFKAAVPYQGALLNLFAWAFPGYGLVWLDLDLELPISWPEPIGSLELLFSFVEPGWDTEPVGLEFQSFSVKLHKDFGEHNSFEIRARFDKDQLAEAAVMLTSSFSL